jgi:hypothetical protein
MNDSSFSRKHRRTSKGKKGIIKDIPNQKRKLFPIFEATHPAVNANKTMNMKSDTRKINSTP